jgi:hypothetical protein
MIRKALHAIAFSALAFSCAQAQETPVNINGLIDKADATTLVVNADDASVQTLKLAPKVLILQSRSVTLADIKANDYVASAAVKKEDGKLHSTEVRIFPEALRGAGEGQRPMNDPRNQTMTNATVTGSVTLGGSNVLKVKFPQGESELVVDPGVPVTRIEAVEPGALKAGMKVRVQGVRGADGLVANRINIQ